VAPERPWVSPSDLAEYAFCPRALHYRRTRLSPPSRSADAGEAFHRRRLSAVRWREEHPGLPWLAVAAGVLLVVGAAVVLAR
jgi:CRISPR/Cas system-associated exonuclease Cas4 (RecB family)